MSVRTKDEGLAFDLFQSYRRGWKDGAVRKWPPDPRFVEHGTRPDMKAEYERGFADGTAANIKALGKAMKRLGYDADPLRAGDVDPSGAAVAGPGGRCDRCGMRLVNGRCPDEDLVYTVGPGAHSGHAHPQAIAEEDAARRRRRGIPGPYRP